MFKATEFIYDGIYSGKYGLKLATIDGSIVEETPYTTPQIKTAKPSKSLRFFYQGSKYEEAPKFEMSILAEKPIAEPYQREIISWLDMSDGYKKLILMNDIEANRYEYMCVMNVTNIIYHAGYCVGFKVTATFDSPYMYGKSQKITLDLSTEPNYTKEINYFVDSDIKNNYISPYLTFTTKGKLAGGNDNLRIYNLTDSDARCFKFTNIPIIGSGTNIKVNNELKTIDCDEGNIVSLDNFTDMKWLRLKRGNNRLKIELNGTITIECPTYIKIRF